MKNYTQVFAAVTAAEILALAADPDRLEMLRMLGAV